MCISDQYKQYLSIKKKYILHTLEKYHKNTIRGSEDYSIRDLKIGKKFT